MSENERVAIFKPKDEAIHLLVPLAIPCIALFLWAASRDHRLYLNFNSVYWLRFLVAAIFLDLVHSTFTIFFMFSVPEAKSWLFDRSKVQRIWVVLGFLFLPLFSIYFLKTGMESISVQFASWHVDLWILAMITYVSQSHHILRQSQGLSLNYNRELEHLPLAADQRKQIARSERWERLLFKTLIFFFGLAFAIRILAPAYPKLTQWTGADAIIVGINAALIVLNAFRFHVFKLSNKVSYLLRLLCLPIGLAMGIPLFIGYIYHGPEYLLTLRKMCENSARINKKRFHLLIWVFLIAGIAAFRLVVNPYNGLGYFFQDKFSGDKDQFAWLGAISMTIALFHIYLDSRIFRMKSPRARKYFGPLLFLSRPNSSADQDHLFDRSYLNPKSDYQPEGHGREVGASI